MKKIIILLSLIAIYSNNFAQEKKDTILTYERTIDRPLTMHKGQLQLNAGYNMSIINANYDEDGNKTDLAELGTAALEHSYRFGVKFGILDFLDARFALNYSNKSVRETQEMFLSLNEPITDISYLDNYKGFGDLYIGTGFRYPFKSKTYDIALYPGISIPVSSNEPDQPNHEYIPFSEDHEFIQIYYINNYKYSSGAYQLHLSGAAKLRLKDFGFSFLYESSYPMSISETVRWEYYLENNEFEYSSESYEYLISDKTYFSINAEYQAISWFNVNLDLSGLIYKNGWNEEFGYRLPNPESSLYLMTVGAEVKITSNLWLTQFISFPVSGQNQIAPLNFLTSFSYNIFPF